jgi:hypothetical protein
MAALALGLRWVITWCWGRSMVGDTWARRGLTIRLLPVLRRTGSHSLGVSAHTWTPVVSMSGSRQRSSMRSTSPLTSGRRSSFSSYFPGGRR